MGQKDDIQKKDTQKVKGNVLFFDIGPSIVSPLLNDLSEFDIEFFRISDKNDALKTISKKNIDIVLVDYKPEKPEIFEFLKTLRKKHPSTNRISFSAPEYKSQTIQLVLKGLITSYFENIASPKTVIEGILHILYARETLKNQKLLRLLGTAEVLPTFPKIYYEFMDAIECDLSMRDIGRIIEKDVSIATRVLQIANSDFYRTTQIGSIERAGIYLGLDTIKNIVFAVSLSHLKGLSESQRRFLEKIIYHSVQVNQNFQKMYTQQTGKKISDQYATIGITHDVGKIIMLQYMPNRFDRIIKYRKKNPDIGFYRSEIELGFDGQTHAEIGAYFLNLWNFPEPSVFTALFHHSTEEFSEPYREILDIFAIVNDITPSEEGA
jgi:HD-like signal output (HDOD) protein